MTSPIKEFVLSLVDYMKKAGYVSSPVPNVRLVSKPQTDDPRYAKTGHYSPDENEIVLYTANRHPKDILRTLAHELIHVQQDHEKRLNGFDGRKALKDDQRLRDLEGEAFLKGNLALRDWTEQYTKQKMNEGNMKKALTFKQLMGLVNEAEEKLPITDMGNVLRLGSCPKQKSLCWDKYDGFVFVHKTVNPDFDESKPCLVLIHQVDEDGDFGWQFHFHKFVQGNTPDNVLDDLLTALANTCPNGMELHTASFTPGGIAGYNALSKYGFKKVWLPNNTYSYWASKTEWGGECDAEKLHKWLNGGKHLDEFLVKGENGEMISPKDCKNMDFNYDNTVPRPFKMVKSGGISENTKIIITLKQLKRLINEASDVETGNADFEITDGTTLVKYNGKADKIAIPEGVKVIGEGAFQDNKYIKEVTIPDGVETIEAEAFYKCRGLTKVMMSDSVSEIGEQAFANCVALTEINIGKSVKTLGKNAFLMCQNLQQIVLQEGLVTIDKNAFARTGLTALDIPASVKTIGYDIVSGCQNLQRVSVADQKQYSMFVKNSNLQSGKFNQSNIVVRGKKLNESSDFDGFVVVESADDYEDGKVPWSILDGMRKQAAKNRIYKIVGNDYKGMHKDTAWQHVHEGIFGKMRDAGLNISYGAINDYRHQGGYYRDERGRIAGKEWEFVIDFLNEKGKPIELRGVVIASFGGTVEQFDNDELGPDRPYDLCFYFIN